MVERLRYLGFAEEATFNPLSPPEATQHVDIASATMDVPSETDLVYEGGLSRAAYTRRPGFYAPAGNFVYAFDIQTIAQFLKWTLSGYEFTDGGVGNNTHEIYGNENVELPSFTARLGKDKLDDGVNFEHVFAGCTIGQMQLVASDSFAQATIDLQAAKDSRADIKAIEDLILPDAFPLAFHEVTATLDSVDKSAVIKEVQLTINNNASAADGRSIGSRYPRRIIVGERLVTFQFQIYWESLAELQEFWGGTDGVADAGANELPININVDAGAAGSLDLDMSRAFYTSTQQQASGRSELVQQVSGRALLDRTVLLADGVTEVATELLATVINDQGDLT